MNCLWRFVLGGLVLCVPVLSQAGSEWVSAQKAAPMYDAPSQKAHPRYVALAYTPLEVITRLSGMVKVRGPNGSIGWVEQQLLSTRRTLVVRTDKAEIRNAALASAPLVFTANRDVVLDYLGSATPGWVQVRHADGQSGYVAISQIWGY